MTSVAWLAATSAAGVTSAARRLFPMAWQSVDDFVAGWISGASGVFVTQPIDFVLTRLQAGGAAASTPLLGEGITGLWRGVFPLLATVPLNSALLFYGYGVGVRIAERGESDSGGSKALAPIFLGGCAGGFVQSFLQSPVELVKVRSSILADAPVLPKHAVVPPSDPHPPSAAESDLRMYLRQVRLQLAAAGEAKSSGAVVADLLRSAPAGFFSRGLTATLWRDTLPHGVWFTSYEWAKRTLTARAAAAEHQPPTTTTAGGGSSAAAPPKLSRLEQMGAGGFAAFVAWVFGYPPDLLKTRCAGHADRRTRSDPSRY